MRSHTLNYVAVGTFVLLMIVGVVVAVALLAGTSGPADRYFTVYRNVSGIKFGTLVLFEGYQVGQVAGIEPIERDGRALFRVDLDVRQGFRIPADSEANLALTSFLAPPSIDIRRGAATEPLAPGSEIQAGLGGELFIALTALFASGADLSQAGVPLLTSIQRVVDDVGTLVRGPAPQLLSNLEGLTAELDARVPAITQNLQELTASLSQGSRNVFSAENQRNFDATLASFRRASGNVERLTAELRESKATVDRILGEVEALADQTSGTAEQALDDLAHTLRTVSANIDSIMYNLDGTARNTLELTRQLRDNPAIIIRGRELPEGAGR